MRSARSSPQRAEHSLNRARRRVANATPARARDARSRVQAMARDGCSPVRSNRRATSCRATARSPHAGSVSPRVCRHATVPDDLDAPACRRCGRGQRAGPDVGPAGGRDPSARRRLAQRHARRRVLLAARRRAPERARPRLPEGRERLVRAVQRTLQAARGAAVRRDEGAREGRRVLGAVRIQRRLVRDALRDRQAVPDPRLASRAPRRARADPAGPEPARRGQVVLRGRQPCR